MSSVFVPLMISKVKHLNNKINFGVIFYAIMLAILIIGNISTYVIKYVFNNYDSQLLTTNIYWTMGMFFFVLGFVFNVRKKTTKTKKLYPLNINLIIILFLLSLWGTLVAYYFIGFIPFLKGAGTGERYSYYGTISLFNRLWSYCVVVAVLSFIYINQIKSVFLVKSILFLSILTSLFFIIRMYPFLIFLVLFLLWVTFQKKKALIFVVSTVAVLLFFVGNTLFQDYRSGTETNSLQNNSDLNYVQAKLTNTGWRSLGHGWSYYYNF